MSNSFQQFENLHQGNNLFLLPNVWNAKSASAFAEKGFYAVGTSSAAVAMSLGYADGEDMPFPDYLFIIRRILAAVNIPLTVDLEMGYGKTPDQIYSNIKQLVELGVAGINIEDSEITGGKRSLQNVNEFASLLKKIRSKLAVDNSDLFINVRCDTFILGVENALKQALDRIQHYENAGADGIFLPCISHADDIATVTSNTRLPVNVMCIPGLPDFDALHKLGVKRVSMGPFLFNKMYSHGAALAETAMREGNFLSILS